MTDTQTTNHLEMRWTPAVDKRGRTIMEPHWVLVDETASHPAVPVAHAA